jgi:hypothetical protein
MWTSIRVPSPQSTLLHPYWCDLIWLMSLFSLPGLPAGRGLLLG